MARRAFVDTHIHFWDLKDPNLATRGSSPTGSIRSSATSTALKVLRYAADEFIGETRFQNVSKIVHVQAAIGIDDPVEETRWLQEQADRTGFPHGIVGHCDLMEADAEEQLDRHLEYANFRGVRDFAAGTNLDNPDWLRGLRADGRPQPRLLHRHDVGADARRRAGRRRHRRPHVHGPRRLPAGAHRRVPRELEARHGRGGEVGARDLQDQRASACATTAGRSTRSVRTSSAASRHSASSAACMGTNWPVDRLYSSYGDVLEAYETIISDFSDDEQTRCSRRTPSGSSGSSAHASTTSLR